MDTNKIARMIGQLFGIVLIGCIAACLASGLIALTVKFMTLIF